MEWISDIVDNEYMGCCLLKCCCIYEKFWVFGESFMESDEEEEEGCGYIYCVCGYCKGWCCVILGLIFIIFF